MSALYTDKDAAQTAAEKLKVFAQPQRLMILSCLQGAERNVGEIDDLTGIGQPALSQQLATLRRADLVRTRKEGKEVWYALADDGVALCVRNMEAIFGGVGTPEEIACEPPKPAAPAPPRSGGTGTPDGAAGFARIL